MFKLKKITFIFSMLGFFAFSSHDALAGSTFQTIKEGLQKAPGAIRSGLQSGFEQGREGMQKITQTHQDVVEAISRGGSGGGRGSGYGSGASYQPSNPQPTAQNTPSAPSSTSTSNPSPSSYSGDRPTSANIPFYGKIPLPGGGPGPAPTPALAPAQTPTPAQSSRVSTPSPSSAGQRPSGIHIPSMPQATGPRQGKAPSDLRAIEIGGSRQNIKGVEVRDEPLPFQGRRIGTAPPKASGPLPTIEVTGGQKFPAKVEKITIAPLKRVGTVGGGQQPGVTPKTPAAARAVTVTRVLGIKAHKIQVKTTGGRVSQSLITKGKRR